MKKFKKVTALLLIVVLCLSLCACDTSLDTLLLMRKVGSALEHTKSFEGEFDCSAKAAYGMLPIRLSINGDIKGTTDPMKMQIDTKADLGLLGDIEAKIYIVGSGESLDVYIGIRDLSGKTSWIYRKAALPVGSELDAKGLLKLIDKGSDLLTKGEERRINGTTAVKLTLTMPGDMIAVALGNESGTMSDLVIDAWVNKSDGHIIRVESELSELATLALRAEAGDIADRIEIKELPVTVDIDEYNSVDSIELPQEALKAK